MLPLEATRQRNPPKSLLVISTLGIDVVATACAGQAGEDRRRSATALIADEERVFTIMKRFP
jgi:hypothetical protein